MYFEQRDNRLTIGEFFASDLAKEYGTPLYVTDQNRLETNFKRLHKAFNSLTPTRVYYACKALTNMAVLRILRDAGSYVETVSPGEVQACLRAGFPKEKIIFTSPYPTTEELEQVIKTGVLINLDSLSALERAAPFLKENEVVGLSFRINPEVGDGHHDHCVTGAKTCKFGVPQEDVVNAYKRAVELGLGHMIQGIHAHIGSGILDVEPFQLAVDSICTLAKKVEEETGITLRFIDIGGGYGIPYRPGESELDIKAVAELVVSRFKSYFPGKELAIEPGRYLVADTTALLTTVNTVKHTAVKNYIGVDAGFNNLIRTAMYGSYHHLLHADQIQTDDPTPIDLAGPLCESGDIFHKELPMPLIKEGDVMALLDAGAYGFTMASNYNMRPLVAELLVNGDKKSLMRKRQDIEDLMKDQLMPDWLL